MCRISMLPVLFIFIKNNVTETTDSHVEQDIVLWTNSQRPSDDVHVVAYVHSFYVNSARGGREQAGEDRSDKHHRQKKSIFFLSRTPF